VLNTPCNFEAAQSFRGPGRFADPLARRLEPFLLGVLFSLGSTSVISNVIAGYTMTYRRAFRIGDRVKIGDTTGDVTEMRLLVTHLRTPNFAPKVFDFQPMRQGLCSDN
jgi:hypothetical protein